MAPCAAASERNNVGQSDRDVSLSETITAPPANRAIILECQRVVETTGNGYNTAERRRNVGLVLSVVTPRNDFAIRLQCY